MTPQEAIKCISNMLIVNQREQEAVNMAVQALEQYWKPSEVFYHSQLIHTTMKVKLDDGAYLPDRAHFTDAGYDLRTPRRVVIPPNGNAVVHTGVHIQLPPDKCAVVISKSGLYTKHNISSTGLIDEGFTGEIIINLLNHSGKMHIFEPGDKISQFMLTDYYRYNLELVDELDPSDRGDNGYGSTGR